MKNSNRSFIKHCLLLFFLAVVLFSFKRNAACSNTSGARIAGDTGIIANGATPTLVSRQFSFTEGPAVDREGNVYFTDQPNNRIWEYDTAGKLSLFMEGTGRSNGMYFGRDGNLITCADEQNQLWAIGKDKKVKVLVKGLAGKKFNGPNDLWEAPNGDIYFTDPYYQRSYWTRTKSELDGEHVYLLRHGQREAVRVISDLQQPNGIVGTPDGRWLYVADIKAGKTYRYAIENNGTLKDATLFVDMGSDGMTLDNKGNLYLTGKGVTIFDSTGRSIDHIDLPGWTANVAFGGKQKNILFITASEAVYTLPMNVHGVE